MIVYASVKLCYQIGSDIKVWSKSAKERLKEMCVEDIRIYVWKFQHLQLKYPRANDPENATVDRLKRV